jgi:hypothetical protein
MCSISRSCSVLPPQTPYGSRTTPGADARAVLTSRDNGTPRAVLLFEPADRILLQERRVTLPLRNAYTLAHLEAGFTPATGPLAPNGAVESGPVLISEVMRGSGTGQPALRAGGRRGR